MTTRIPGPSPRAQGHRRCRAAGLRVPGALGRWSAAVLLGGSAVAAPPDAAPPDAAPRAEAAPAAPAATATPAPAPTLGNPDWAPAHWPARAAQVSGLVLEIVEGTAALRFDADNPNGAALRAEHAGDRALTLRLSPARLRPGVAPPTPGQGIAHVELRTVDDGVEAAVTFSEPTAVVVDGNRLRVRYGPAGRGRPLPPPAAEGLPVALPSTAKRGAGAEPRALDAALDALGRGEHVEALAGLLALDEAEDPGTRWLALLWQGRLLRRLNLPLLAIEPLARVATACDDAAVRTDAATELLAEVERAPEAARLVQVHLSPRGTESGLTWPPRWAALLLDEAQAPDAVEARLVLLAGRLALAEGRRAEAATLFRLAARRGRLRAEAQWLVGLAAGAAPGLDALDPAEQAAQTHFEVLLGRTDSPADLQARAALGLARVAYGRGDLSAASAAYDRVPDDHPARRLADLERHWIALRAAAEGGSAATVLGDRVALLDRLVPFDLGRDGEAHALLVATLYLGVCHPRRAEHIASRVLDALARDRVGERLADERARALELARGHAALEAALGARLTALRARHEAALPRSATGRARHEWLRVRISADAVLSASLERRRQARFAEKTPDESRGFAWEGTRFIPGEPIDAGRCARLELPDPLVPPGL